MPVSVFLTRMPACKGNAVWLTGGYIPKDCRLRQLWKEKVSTENVRCGCVWKESSWQVERCWEILHRGDDSSEKREVHKWLPGAILLCQEGRHKKNCFFQILPFQLKPQGSWRILSWCFFLCLLLLLWILPELLQRSTTSTQFLLLQCHVISCISCPH